MGSKKLSSVNNGHDVSRRAELRALELTRATERAAIAAARKLGLSGDAKRPNLVDAAAKALLTSFESEVSPDVALVYVDARDLRTVRETQSGWTVLERQKEKPAAPELPPAFVHNRSNIHAANWELVISPIDGKGAATRGIEGGSIAVIAGGPLGSFVDPTMTKDELESYKRDLGVKSAPSTAVGTQGPAVSGEYPEGTERFLLITVSRDLKSALPGGKLPVRDKPLDLTREAICKTYSTDQLKKLPDFLRRKPTRDEQLHAHDGLSWLLSEYLDLNHLAKIIAGELKVPPTASILSHDVEYWMVPVRNKFERVRYYHGSSVAAAIATLQPRNATHISFSVARRTHVIQAAVAARTLGGEIFACRLRPVVVGDKKKNEKELKGYQIKHDFKVLESKSFVLHENVFLVASGITDHAFLRGVVFQPNNRANVSSICLSAITGSRMSVQNDIALTSGQTHTSEPRQGANSTIEHMPDHARTLQ